MACSLSVAVSDDPDPRRKRDEHLPLRAAGPEALDRRAEGRRELERLAGGLDVAAVGARVELEALEDADRRVDRLERAQRRGSGRAAEGWGRAARARSGPSPRRAGCAARGRRSWRIATAGAARPPPCRRRAGAARRRRPGSACPRRRRSRRGRTSGCASRSDDAATRDWATTWGHSSRVERAGRARRAARSTDPTRRSVARRSCVRRGAARRGCRTCRAARCRTRSAARESPRPPPRGARARVPPRRERASRLLAAGLDPPALGLEALLARRGSRRAPRPAVVARHLGPIHEVDERRRAEDEGAEAGSGRSCSSACTPPGWTRTRPRTRGGAGDVGGQGRHPAERQPDDADRQHEQHDVRHVASVRAGEPRPGERGEHADDRAERADREPRRGASPLSRWRPGHGAWRGRGARAPSRSGATGPRTRRGSSASGCSPRAISASSADARSSCPASVSSWTRLNQRPGSVTGAPP